MKSPDLTIIIPYFNQADGLSKCLQTLENQKTNSHRDIEVIVVDNGSDKFPADVCANYQRVTLLEEKTPGPGPARNMGVSAAQSELLAFIDADCRPDLNWIDTICEHFGQHASAQVIGGDVRIDHESIWFSDIAAYESIFGYRFKLYIERDHYAGTGNLAMRKGVFAAVGEFAGLGIAEDRDWGQRAHAKGFRLDYLDRMVVYTPARSSFEELKRKWDRHIAHDRNVLGSDFSAIAQWIVRSLALSISPLLEIPTVVMTDRVSGFQNKLRAMRCLARIRLYRAWRMLSVIPKSEAEGLEKRWRDG